MNKIGFAISITVCIVSLFLTILYIDVSTTNAKIKQIQEESAEMMACEVWDTELHECASDALTTLYKKYHGGGIN